MTVKLLTEHHLKFLSLTGGYTGWIVSTLVKVPHCWKSLVVAQIRPLVHVSVRHCSDSGQHVHVYCNSGQCFRPKFKRENHSWTYTKLVKLHYSLPKHIFWYSLQRRLLTLVQTEQTTCFHLYYCPLPFKPFSKL